MTEDICNLCESLDIEKGFNMCPKELSTTYDGVLLASTGQRYQFPLPSDCPLYSMLTECRESYIAQAQDDPSLSFKDDEIPVFSYPSIRAIIEEEGVTQSLKD
jgi:hypothetical protein